MLKILLSNNNIIAFGTVYNLKVFINYNYIDYYSTN